MDTNRIFFLGNQADLPRENIGSKAYNLNILKLQGLEVPDGFVLFTVDYSDYKFLEKSIGKIGGFPVAVRSSGGLEDLGSASFAGLYETFLNVSTMRELITTLGKCFASASSQRVRQYLQRMGLGAGKRLESNFCVLVQSMIAAEYAGVAFSLNPLTGKEEEFLIEACTGLGERLVSGQTTPSSYSGPYSDPVAGNFEPGDQNTILKENSIKEIAEQLLKIQACFKHPQDIEWAIDKDSKLWILQSRPITKISWRNDVEQFTNADLKDGGVSARACTPLMFSLYRTCFDHAMSRYFDRINLIQLSDRHEWMIHKYGRVYWNAGATKRALFKIPGFSELDFDLDLGIQKDYGAKGPYTAPVSAATILTAIRVLLGMTLEYYNCTRMVRRFAEAFERSDAKLKAIAEVSTQMDDRDFFRLFESIVTNYYFKTESSYFRVICNNANFQSEFKRLLAKIDSLSGRKSDLNRLMSGLSNISHLEMQKAFVSLFEKASSHGMASEEFRQELAVFLKKNYHHGDAELDILEPRWGENPSIVENRIASLLEKGLSPIDPVEAEAKQKTLYQTELNAVLKAIAAKPFTRLIYKYRFPYNLKWLRNFLIMREKMREYSTRAYYTVRLILLEIGNRLKKAGIINDQNDVFMFHIEELVDYCRHGMLQDKTMTTFKIRKQLYMGYYDFSAPNEFGSGISEACEDSLYNVVDGKTCFKGIPCSSGTFKGLARIILDLKDSGQIRQGDILVTKFTDPGWTPVLGMVSGVVTEVGGMLSHAAVIGREYGIPVVMNIKGITTKIESGQEIYIDGNKGLVTII